jgi:hypothetical protein
MPALEIISYPDQKNSQKILVYKFGGHLKMLFVCKNI